MAELAGEFGLENKLSPMLMWLLRHVIRAEICSTVLYPWAPSSDWVERLLESMPHLRFLV